MRAIVFDGQLRLDDQYPEPQPGPREALIRTTLAGICKTDLEITRGYAGFDGVPGHEFVGVVESADDPDLMGRRVVGEINIGCGACQACKAGRKSHCIDRTALGIRHRDGVFAEYFTLPTANLHLVPASVPDARAVFTEPLAAACEILEQVHVRPDHRVLVLGDGRLGLLTAQVLATTGCDLEVIGHHPKKLRLLSPRGIPTRLEAAGLTASADMVVDCSGSPSGFATACNLVRPQGTIVLKSTYPGMVPADLSALVVREVRLVGSRCGPFRPALRLIAQNRVRVDDLVEAQYPLSKGLEAFAHAGQRGSLKVLIEL